MNYQQTIKYLFEATPVFQHSGGGAYKPGLERVMEMAKRLNHPEKDFPIIHIAGTNGKGSTCHTLSAILQAAGYKVGLFTSPHLIDFRERIRINGTPIDEQFVVDFVDNYKALIEDLQPSFFEYTSIMAFKAFSEKKVDIAIVEVGMGGRLDSTNIVDPILSIITGISLDHTQFLGNTLQEIAREKGGIIKPAKPTVIGPVQKELRETFSQIAENAHSPIFFADDSDELKNYDKLPSGHFSFDTKEWGKVEAELMGDYQLMNAKTILTALPILKKADWQITPQAVKEGFAHVTTLTGLLGRWQIISPANPRIVCDTGHNIEGISFIVNQLKRECTNGNLHIVFGMVNDKDISGVLSLLPQNAIYYFTQASVARAMPAKELTNLASTFRLNGTAFESIEKAYQKAREKAKDEDLIFIGGSNFIIADFYLHLKIKYS